MKYYLTEAEMQKLSTKRLLAYKKKYLNHIGYYSRDSYGSPDECDKQQIEAYDAIRRVLNTREHVERRPNAKR